MKGDTERLQEAQNRVLQEVQNRTLQEVQSRALLEAQSQALQEAQNRTLQEVQSRALLEAQSQALQEAQNRTLQEVQSRALLEAQSRALQEAQNRTLQEVQSRALLEAQSRALQAEIAVLRGLHQQRESTMEFKGRMRDALLSLSGKLRAEETVSTMRAEVEEMEEDVKRQTQMSGISLTSCTVKTLQKNDRGVVQQYSLAGRCLDLHFQVDFQLSEAQSKTITAMDIVLDTDDISAQHISSFVSRAEEHCDLLQFFRMLQSFSERCEERGRTFQHFQEKYPSVVSLPEGSGSEVMNLSHPQLPGCVLAVHWSVVVSKEGDVTSQIHLLPRVPQTVYHMDSARTLEGAPESFHSLLSLLGTEAALENLILALST